MKDPLKILNDLKDTHLIYLSAFFAMISPSVGTLLIFFPDTFIQMNVFQLLAVILGFGFTSIIPTWFLLIGLIYTTDRGNRYEGRIGLMLFSVTSIFIAMSLAVLQLSYFVFFREHGFTPYIVASGIFIFLLSPLLSALFVWWRRRNGDLQ